MTAATATRPGPAPAPQAGDGGPRSPRTRHPAVRRTAIAALASFLGAVTLKGLLRDDGWLIDVALTIVVVSVPAALLRLRRPPGALDVWPGVLLMIPWLTARFVPHHAFGGFIPTRSTMHDVSLLMTSLHHTTHDQSAPVISTPAVRLVLCALVGLLTALIDLVAVVGRRGALAGIPLLVVYTVSGAVPRQAVAWQWFVLAACGFLLLLSLDASDDRASWGHRVPDPRGEQGRTVVARVAPRLAAIAIAIAVVVPLALPVQSTNLLAEAFHHRGGAGGFGARNGGGGTISPFAALRDQLNQGKPSTVMTVHVSGDTRVTPFYLRVNVLDKYSDAGWSVSDHGDITPVQRSDLDTEPAEADPDLPSTDFTAQITPVGLGGNPPIFAALTQVKGVQDGTAWSPQDQLLLGSNVQRGKVIVEQVSQPDPTVADLDASRPSTGPAYSRWLAKPTLPATVVDTVDELTRDAPTPYLKARAINNYFTDPDNGFIYSLQTAVGDSGSALVDFLQLKQGFCQQYAAAMAIMLRQAGVPSRVVLGYMHPAPDADGNFTVTTNDAHAWVEAYFSGLGWIPFDPTPAAGLTGGAKSDLAWAPHDYAASGETEAPVKPTRPAVSVTPARPSRIDPTQSLPTATGNSTGGNWWPAVITVLIVLAVLAAASVPAVVRARRRRRRLAAARHGDAAALWTELCDTAIDLGYVWSPARSPRQVNAWLASDVGPARPALERLSGAVEHARYSSTPRAGDPGQGGEVSGATLGEELREISSELRAGRSARTRFMALVWPRSLGWGTNRRR